MTPAPLRCQDCGIAGENVRPEPTGYLSHDGSGACLDAALALLRECRPYIEARIHKSINDGIYDHRLDDCRNLLSRMPP